MNASQLLAIMPNAGPHVAMFLPALVGAMKEFGLNTLTSRAAFMATVAHETGQLSKLEENLNYSAAALTKTWPQRFPSPIAALYARQPERIANLVYADREGNRSEGSGDGWRNRGAGAIHLTFENNHAACGRYFGVPRDQVADWLRTPEGACRSAGWFWHINRVNRYADVGDFDGVSDVVNRGKKTDVVGDAIGWPVRLAYFETGLKVLS